MLACSALASISRALLWVFPLTFALEAIFDMHFMGSTTGIWMSIRITSKA